MDYDDECDIHLGKSIQHPLLRKPLCGRTKICATKGIKGDETFGRPSPKGELGVAGALQYEEFDAEKAAPKERDFRKLNKEAAKVGVTTARGFYEFRKDHDYRLSPRKEGWKSHNPGLYDPQYTYGISTKPDGIMKPVMEGTFGREWLERQDSIERTRSRSLSPKRSYTVTVNPKTKKRGGLGTSTKQAIADSEEALAEKDQKQTVASFKMREFMSVRPKVETRRTTPPKKLPRLRKNWETGEVEEVLDDGTVVGTLPPKGATSTSAHH